MFASDALSSVAYAPDEVFIMLGMAGATAYAYSWPVGIAVAVVMLTVVASYRQNVHAYPSGGGDYEVATVNLGPTAGVTVATVNIASVSTEPVANHRRSRVRNRCRGAGCPVPAAT